MTQHYKKLLSLLFIFVLSFSVQALEVGKQAPKFSLPVASGTTEKTLEQYQGQVIYLDFWASWCPPCRTSFPLLEELYQRHKNAGFTVVAINMDEDLEAMEKFLNLYKINFDILRDASGELADIYGVEAMPTSFIIDKKGIIRHIHSGFFKNDIVDIEKNINVLLKEKL